MAEETRFERRLEGWIDRATTPRGAAMVIATATIVITLAAGLVMTVIDRDNYPSLGEGLWWAVQTTTTVGYGDDVPTTVAGRLLAVLIDVLRDRLPDRHHRRDHQHVRRALASRVRAGGHRLADGGALPPARQTARAHRSRARRIDARRGDPPDESPTE